jgi:hypothetical protein
MWRTRQVEKTRLMMGNEMNMEFTCVSLMSNTL